MRDCVSFGFVKCDLKVMIRSINDDVICMKIIIN